jgi:hypothetical protein
MRTLSFAVVIATMAPALHAEPLEDLLETLGRVSGLHDQTVLLSLPL